MFVGGEDSISLAFLIVFQIFDESSLLKLSLNNVIHTIHRNGGLFIIIECKVRIIVLE